MIYTIIVICVVLIGIAFFALKKDHKPTLPDETLTEPSTGTSMDFSKSDNSQNITTL